MDDLGDELERVVGAQPEPDERDVGALSIRHHPDLSDVDLSGDHLAAEAGNNLREQLEAIVSLVGDQNA